jgi:hypothetical protein
MTDDPARIETSRIEAGTIGTWFAAARQKQTQFGPAAPRSIAGSAQTLIDVMGLTAPQAEAAPDAMAFWHLFLPSVLGSDPANFTDARERLPSSFESVRRGVTDAAAYPQLVFLAFHMAGFPLLAAMVASSVAGVHDERGHVLVARRNLMWLRTDAGRWVGEVAEVIATDSHGLRRLHTGLREGSIRRLLILVDGPHTPGPLTHPLTSMTPRLGFKTTLLRVLFELEIPVLPVTHFWDGQGLQIAWQPFLDPVTGIATTADRIESLLRRAPTQWLNWAAARAALAR